MRSYYITYNISKFFLWVDGILRSFINIVILEHCSMFCFFILIATTMIIINFLYSASLTFFEAISLMIAAAAALVAIFTFVGNHKTNTIRHYAEGEARILEFGRVFPNIVDPTRTDKYSDFKIGSTEFLQYESLAHYSLKLCWEIYDEPFWNRSLKMHFIALFESMRRLHWQWLNDNASLFNKEFVSYMKTADWRNIVNPNQADQLRWIYEVDLYDRIVLSPLHPLLQNKLFSKIEESVKQHMDSRNKNYKVADMGCGNGKLLKWLVELDYTSELFGIDYSNMMIMSAKKTIEDLPQQSNNKIKLVNCDLRNLSQCQNKFDIVFSINSILPRDHTDMPVMLREIASSIKKNGLFIAILPSFDTVIDLKNLDEKKLRTKYTCEGKKNPAKLAKKEVNRIYREKKLDVKHSIYADDGVNPQRFFKKKEIDSVLKEVKLSELQLEKFLYPWNLCKQYGWGYHPDEQECVYDWFLVARKE